MPRNFFGNYTDFYIYYQELRNGSATDEQVKSVFLRTVRYELIRFVSFYAGVIKGVGFPLGLLLQILTVIFLVRGNSGYSRSARNWFLLVVGADIGSTVYRVYETVTQDFGLSNPYSSFSPSTTLSLAMWGLRQPDHEFLQKVICKVFFIILYFPINLSPIALTVSSLIRGYCVKFPLRAKATFTTCIDRCLMSLVTVIALAISIAFSVLLITAFSAPIAPTIPVLGITVSYGDCSIPRYDVINAVQGLMSVGYIFLLSVNFAICALNLVSSLVIILVLFEARRNRKQIASSERNGSNSELRATAMLLGMNVTIFLCFFISRLLIVISTKIDYFVDPFAYVIAERMGSYLFTVPYYTNSVFIAGFSRRFYEFLLPCAVKPIVSGSSQSKSTE